MKRLFDMKDVERIAFVSSRFETVLEDCRGTLFYTDLVSQALVGLKTHLHDITAM